MEWGNFVSKMKLFTGLLSEKAMMNFLYLSLSVLIYCSEKLVREHLDLAHSCVLKFLKGAEELYGVGFMTPVCHQVVLVSFSDI